MRNARDLFLMFIMFVLSSASFAVTTGKFHETSQGNFDRGELENVSTTSDGDVLLSPLVEKFVDLDELYVWTLAVDNNGNLYAGTGNDGKIYKISSSGEISLLYDSPELEVQSLTLDGRGNVYAGTSPRGIIYKISDDGEVTTFCDLPDCHIWCLLFDSKGNLYAGTGNEGRIYRITPDGKESCFYDSSQSHILCLRRDEDNNLYAGSEPDGIVYKLTPEGSVSVLYDAVETEIHALALDRDGNLYAGTAGGSIPIEENSAQPPGKVPAEKIVRAVPNSVYRISSSGYISRLFTSKYLILSIIPDMSGNIYVGTGNEGMMYKVSQDKKVNTVLNSSELQILSMVWQKDKLYFATGNMGCIYSLADSYSQEGFFTSIVHDAYFISQWGNISWNETLPKGTEILFQSRSGNTEKPDDTWSEWSKDYSDFSGEKIKSPKGRFIQCRAHLKSRFSSVSPVLHDVTVRYLAANQPPEIGSVGIEGYNIKVEKADEKDSRKELNKGEKMATWEAADPNGDTLTYSIYYRGQEEKNWKQLKEDIEENSYRWDSVAFPDGYYLLKIVATDKMDNPAEKAMMSEKISEPFLIDNTPPEVKELEITEETTIKGVAYDDTSRILQIEYSLDGEDWIDIFPGDDIFDSKNEVFEFTVSTLSSGEHTVVVKATDSESNVGAGKVIFDTK